MEMQSKVMAKLAVDERHIDYALTVLAQGYNTNFVVYRIRVQGENGDWLVLGDVWAGGIIAQRFVSDKDKSDKPSDVFKAAVLDMVKEVVESWPNA
jgi:hypothetical protein